jgi:hypothetical protein
VKLVAREVLWIAVENIAGNQAGLTNPVEELVATLILAVGCICETEKCPRDGQHQSDEDPVDRG